MSQPARLARGRGRRAGLPAGVVLIGALLAACAPFHGARQDKGGDVWRVVPGRTHALHYAAGNRGAALDVSRMVEGGVLQVEGFFGEPFTGPFDLRVFPDRASLTEYWRRAWNAPEFEPQCWMVASGTASTLAVLSPEVWKTQACEHDPSDRPATQNLLTHEIVHVYHGQRNPDPEFQDAEEIGWFVEGVAVLASGQLDGPRTARAREALASGKGPARLADAWSGPNRYGFAGSLVSHIDRTRGRQALLRLLRCTSNREVLAALGTSEEELLDRWKEDLSRGVPPAGGG